MSKTKKVVLIGNQTFPLEGVSVKIPLGTLAKLLAEEKKETTVKCITSLRPFVTGQSGRIRLEELEIGCEEELILIREEAAEVPDVVFVDEQYGKIIEEVDYDKVIQTIRCSNP